MQMVRLLPGAALALMALIGGCGGGGSSTATAPLTPAPPAPVTAPPAPAASGLVPAAGALGATLYADAAPLRVLRDGAAWTYRGVEQVHGAASTSLDIKAYTNIVKQSTVSGGVLESGSNPFNGGADTNGPLRFEGGAYKYAQSIALSATGPAQLVDMTELRSPVRVNDQYVALDKHIADGGTDLDGDKINEGIDMAAYSRVVGDELLDLPNRRQVRAVRVDTTLRARAIMSKTGAAGALFEAVQSVWYAPGIGIVKTSLDEPDPNGPALPHRIVTETLENWDGLTEGLGHLDLAAPVGPAGSVLAGVALGYPLDTAGFDAHAVVVTSIAGQGSATGVTVGQLDARGVLVAAKNYLLAELFPGAQYFNSPRLLRVGSELRMLAMTDKGISMVGMDATGQRITMAGKLMLSDPIFGYDNDSMLFHAMADGGDIWVGWTRRTSDDARLASAALQRFDASGQALAPATVMQDPVAKDIGQVRLAVADKRVVMSWRLLGLAPGRYYRVFDAGSGALGPTAALGDPYEPCRFIEAVALKPGLALMCIPQPYGSSIGAARIGADGALALTPGTAIAGDVLKAPWLTATRGNEVFEGSGGNLTGVVGQSGRYWPEDRDDKFFLSVFQTRPATGPLASAEMTLLARIPETIHVATVIPMGNRLLLIGADGYFEGAKLRTMVVWQQN